MVNFANFVVIVNSSLVKTEIWSFNFDWLKILIHISPDNPSISSYAEY